MQKFRIEYLIVRSQLHLLARSVSDRRNQTQGEAPDLYHIVRYPSAITVPTLYSAVTVSRSGILSVHIDVRCWLGIKLTCPSASVFCPCWLVSDKSMIRYSIGSPVKIISPSLYSIQVRHFISGEVGFTLARCEAQKCPSIYLAVLNAILFQLLRQFYILHNQN